MEFISSDTNIWIDFKVINRLTLPFLLPYNYIMYFESMTSELLNPEGFKEELEEAGLIGVDISIEEFILANSFGPKYPRLSIQDRIALAIAKEMLAYVRGKYTTLPIPDSEATLNQADLLSDARDEKKALIEQLRDMLDQTSRQNQLDRKAQETENLQKILKGVPMCIYIG